MAKRKRASNYTDREVDVLVDAVVMNRSLLFSKCNDAATSRRKGRAWETIVMDVNAVGQSGGRCANELRIKWRKLASDAKQKAARRVEERRRTGGGAPPAELTPTEEKILSCIPDELIEGIPGGVDSSKNPPL